MKKMFLVLVMVMAFVITGVNAQTAFVSNSFSNKTNNSSTVTLTVGNIPPGTVVWLGCSYGPSPNVNLIDGPTIFRITSDTAISFDLTQLIASTMYKFQSKLSPGTISGVIVSTIDSFTTLGCFQNPSVSSSLGNNFCFGSSTTLSPSIMGDSYQWKLNGSNIAGANLQNYSTNVTGNYNIDVTIDGCTQTSTVFPLTVNPLPTATTGNDVAICSSNNVTLGNTSTSGHTYLWSPSTGLSSASVANPVTSPSATTTYTLTETVSGTGCQKTNSVTITVNSLPTVTATFNSPTVCNGTQVTLNLGGANIYTSNGNTVVGSSLVFTPTSTTTLSVVGTNSYGCSNTTSATVTVISLPNPNITGDNNLCVGESTLLNASGGTSCVWSPSTGLSSTNGLSVTANPPSTTTYSATVTNSNGCSNTATFLLTVNPLPTVDLLLQSSVSQICKEQINTIVDLSANVSGVWSGPGVSDNNTFDAYLVPAGKNVVTFVHTDNNGCTKTATETVVVDSIPIITGSILAMDSTNGSQSLTVHGFFTGALIVNIGDSFYIASEQRRTTAIFENIIANNGNKVVFKYEGDGCFTDPIIIGHGTVGINELKNENGVISIYPNPCTDKISISTSESNVKYQIFSMTGQIVKIGMVNGGEEIDISNLPKNLYVLKSEFGNAKFIKQ